MFGGDFSSHPRRRLERQRTGDDYQRLPRGQWGRLPSHDLPESWHEVHHQRAANAADGLRSARLHRGNERRNLGCSNWSLRTSYAGMEWNSVPGQWSQCPPVSRYRKRTDSHHPLQLRTRHFASRNLRLRPLHRRSRLGRRRVRFRTRCRRNPD